MPTTPSYVFASTLAALRTLAAHFPAGDTFEAGTVCAKRLKEHDSRPSRRQAAITGSRKVAAKVRNAADSEGLDRNRHWFSTGYGTIRISRENPMKP